MVLVMVGILPATHWHVEVMAMDLTMPLDMGLVDLDLVGSDLGMDQDSGLVLAPYLYRCLLQCQYLFHLLPLK